jgi:hypothetical protein
MKKLHYPVNINEYQTGKVVLWKTSQDNKIGHIVGFGENSFKEVTIKVNWSDGQQFSVHPGNIELL